MAKIKHNNFIDTVDEMISKAKEEQVLHLYAEGTSLNGRTIQIQGKSMLHFGTTGYLGLEQDNRIKEAAMAAIQNYGTQFPLSKTYISNPLYATLEAKIQSMYGVPPIITKNSTLGHLAVIPTMVRDEDVVILDHQVHWSVQQACQQLKLRGVPVEMIRHSNLTMLEDKIKEHKSTCKKIWYMADGVYSMFGDYAPVKELIVLSQKYPQLQLYFDDVHGMSWKGKNGTGFIYEQLESVPENVFIMSTLSKTFGASGAMLITSDRKVREKIKNFGGPLTFSAQLEPASVAAAIASAEIHLSSEIGLLQSQLSERVAYFNQLLSQTEIPLVIQNDAPVFFVGTGTPATTYNLTQKLLKEGFFVNPGLFPAVPVKNSGIRITVSLHNQKEDIKLLSEALEQYYPKALEETDNSQDKVKKSFGITQIKPIQGLDYIQSKDLQLQFETTIKNIDKKVWDSLMSGQSVFDWQGLAYLEEAFSNNPDSYNNWNFYYYIVKDKTGTPLLATFFTLAIWKDDLLSPESVSKQIEEKRKANPLYHTSKVLSMGSLFTEGNHCYLNAQHPLVNQAQKILLEKAEQLYHNLDADMMVYRDFEANNNWNELLHQQGFVKIDMPDSCVVENNSWISVKDFVATLSARSQKHFRRDIMPYESFFDIVCKHTLSEAELIRVYELYTNVKNHNLAINTFSVPLEAFRKMNQNQSWEFILLRTKIKESDLSEITGVAFCYKNSALSYVPVFVGMDYGCNLKFNLYRQLLFQIIKRANALGYEKVDFGFSATFEKRKLGAQIIPKVAYIQSKDNFVQEALSVLQNESK